MRTLILTRAATRILAILIPALLATGCDWYAQEDIALRALPYPYEAGVAVDDRTEPGCLASRGVKFVYDDEEVRTAGQGAACSLVDRGKQLWESLAFLYSRREWRGSSFFANRLFEPRTSGDGITEYSYKRYAGSIAQLPLRMPSDVAAQVAEAVAYELKAKGGVMIVAGPSTDRQGLFASVTTHMRLEHQRGGVYYVERDRLLAYGFVRRYLEWNAARTNGEVIIHVSAVDDGVTEPWIPTLKELEGITFYTPDPERTRVLVAGQELSNVSVNPPDRTRRGSVTVRPTAVQPIPPGTSP